MDEPTKARELRGLILSPKVRVSPARARAPDRPLTLHLGPVPPTAVNLSKEAWVTAVSFCSTHLLQQCCDV